MLNWFLVLLMPATANKYQSTTVRMPKQVYEQAKKVAGQSEISSFNEFVIQAIEEKVRRMTEAEIDAAFAQMASDPEYQRDSIAMAGEFEVSDWEAFKSSDNNSRAKHRSTKTRSR